MSPIPRRKKVLASLAVTNIMILCWLKKRRKRRLWTRNWLQRRHNERGSLFLLNKELKLEDPNSYTNFLRMDETSFSEILNAIETDISKENTFMRQPISARHRLNITLRFLATGESYRSLMYSMRVYESTISKIVAEVCNAICKNLKQTYLKTPTTEEEWLEVAMEFERQWQFPNCIGALDGRHITFTAPISSGPYYFNYKNTNSIVLLALADANYRFIYANIGVNGRISDGGVFQQSNLYKGLINNSLNLPKPKALPGIARILPFVIVADDAFPLMPNLMKHFPQRDLTVHNRIYNYRLSRARRMVESSFGILANRWRILHNPIHLSPEKVQLITSTCVVLHNFLCTKNGSDVRDISENDIYDNNLRQISAQVGNAYSRNAKDIRENFASYFNNEGQVSWQQQSVNQGNY